MRRWIFLIIASLSIISLIFGLVVMFFRRRENGMPFTSPIEHSKIPISYGEPQESELDVHYRLEGDPENPLLILVHGLGANLNCWRRVFPYLTKDFQVLAFDLPGFGLTPNPNDYFGEHPDQLVELTIALIKKLNLKTPAHLAGNSMGGVISLALMESHPELFKSAFLINPALSRKLAVLKMDRLLWLAEPLSRVLNRGSLLWLYSRTLAKPELLEPQVLDHLARNYIGNPSGIRNFARYIRLIQEQSVPQIDYANCMFLFSQGDRVVTLQHQKRISKFFPHAKSIYHPTGGHQFQEDEPEWLSHEMTEFFLSS